MENSNRHLHIVSFAIPYPATYGGVIDVFYKIKSLYNQGVKIHLHNFTYGDRKPEKELEKYCESVHYYQRKTGLRSALSTKPYIAKSRKSESLIQNLLKNNYPILFEGLHSCAIINDPRLKNRFKIYREANIEHHYYYSLFKADKNIGNKLYFLVESLRLKLFQKIINHADLILTVSKADQDYMKNHFPKKDVSFIPCFHSNQEINIQKGKGDYALYNGNLTIAENIKAAEYLIHHIFKKNDIPFYIVGKNPPKDLLKLADKYSNIKVIADPSDEEMESIIQNAHVNILVTFQGTGLKLKLLNTLYKGRFNLVNSTMLNGTGLEEACIIADTPEEMKNRLEDLFTKSFEDKDLQLRHHHLNQYYCNIYNSKKVIELIWK